jgi:hypothetical protein
MLTGVWNSDVGGKYYIHQLGDIVWWYGEGEPTHPGWAHVAHGKIGGNRIALEWADIPKGRAHFNGILIVEISADERTLRALYKFPPGFSTSVWTKESDPWNL